MLDAHQPVTGRGVHQLQLLGHIGRAALRPRHGGHPMVLRAEDDQVAVAQQLRAAVHRQNPRRAEGEPKETEAMGHAMCNTLSSLGFTSTRIHQLNQHHI